ncbi:MAG: CHAT domain-containing protein [Stigonema ocellatum SAG 48.90 = DSM 106950]|nr:CHAT domain-containing protein [Stigonema ocellatum SAG 48.90 = DSM 106950]
MLYKRKFQNFIKKIYNRDFLFLVIFLFLISAVTPPVVVAISSPTPMVESQQDGGQLAKSATKLYRAGQFEQAAVAWQQTAKVFAAKGDGLNQAMALSNLSLTYQQLGQLDQATKAIEKSLELLKTQPQGKEQLKILAQTLDVQGYLQRETGKSTDALKTWQQATKTYSQIDEPDKLAQSKINQAQAMQDLGLYPRACNTLLEALNKKIEVESCQELGQISSEKLKENLQKVANESPSPTIVVGLRSLGELLRVVGQREQSEIILTTSLTLAQKLNSRQDQAAAYLSLGNTAIDLAKDQRVRRQREDYEQKALSYYQNVVKISTSPIIQQQAQLNQLSFMLFKLGQLEEADKPGQLEEAEKLWRSLNPQLSNLSPSRTGVYNKINFAHTFIELAEKDNSTFKANSQLPTFNDIDQILATAAQQARSLGDKRAEAYALQNRSRLYILIGPTQDLSLGEKFSNQALSIVSTFESPDIAYQVLWQLGRIRKAQGNIEDAIAAYTKAYIALQSLRSDLVTLNPEVQFSFRESVEPVYRELVDLDLQSAVSFNKADKNNQSEKRLTHAREVIESLQLAEINNFFREVCVEANTKPIDKIDPTAAVIYPIILPDRLEVLLSLPNQPPRLYTKNIPKQHVENIVEKVQRSLITPQSLVKDFLPLYQEVYNWLIQPLETDLANNSNVKTLTFVLDGDLRNIPMNILYDGKQFLVERYAIALTPGLQLVNPKPLAEINLKALTAGLSEIPKNGAGQDFAPLLNVRGELQQIKESGHTSGQLLNEHFTSKELKKELAASRVPPIVHLATHGRFSSKVEDTFILSWDSRINVKQLGDLLRNNTLSQGRPIELLVLSACETASGDKRAALGLAGVAVRAGARSTVATLWAVVDKSTAQIMGEFYRQLDIAKAKKLSKAEALRQAQLILKKDENFSHPHFWAPFVMVGNWQ